MKKYVGLDVGTNSIGWAVTDENYNLLKKKKTPLLGVHLFDDAQNRDERRSYRTARRTTRRRKWRITILQELFNEEISKVDFGFFKRLKLQKHGLFTTGDKEYFKKYPTIHHLIRELMETSQKPNICHVYLVCSYYMKHRGHFYSNVSADEKLEKVLSLGETFQEFCETVKEHTGLELKYKNIKDIEEALSGSGVSLRKAALKGKLTAKSDEENVLPVIITLLAGGKIDLGKLFSADVLLNEKVNINEKDLEEAQEIASMLGEKFEVLEKAKRVTDWSVLKNILQDEKSINTQRLALYQKVKDDKELRGDKLIEYMKERHAENRVIPYQLQWADFKRVLENIRRFYPNLDIDKIGKLFKHRIPYYVGPLREGEFSWVARHSDKKLYPWNFDEYIDKTQTRENFIRRMTAKCTFYVGADMLPKESLLYTKYVILDQLNCIRINGNRIDNNVKQQMFEELFLRENKTIFVKNIKAWLVSKNLAEKNAEITGIDATVKGTMKAYHKFMPYIKGGKLTIENVEEVVNRLTVFGSERSELKPWLSETFKKLTDGESKAILRFAFKDYGRFSREFLEDVLCNINGTQMGIIQAMWETNNNLMELLSDKFGYKAELNEINSKKINPEMVKGDRWVNERLDDLYISNRVRRMIFRALAVFDDILEVQGGELPDKIFIEMAREDGEKKRTKSRKNQLKELLKGNTELLNELENKTDDDLRGKKLYLYFAQMGRCIYTNKAITLSTLFDDNLWDIDHIYPRSKVKDDSLHNNLVLVCKQANGQKGDGYPLPSEWQANMRAFWGMLKDKSTKNESLMNAEKFSRLMRTTDFTEDEKVDFINRQLVETRQSTKALATILKEKYNVDVTYVKAGLISDFRQEFGYPKCRELNDYHHAKDAYLNIVCGNVYDSVFTRSPRSFIKSAQSYSIKTETLYNISDKIKNNWQSNTHEIIRQTMENNKVKYTEFAYENRGSLWGKTLGLTPRKGDYSNAKGKVYELSTCFFALVSHETKKGKETRLLPIYNYCMEEFERDSDNYFENVYPVLNKDFNLKHVRLIRKIKLKSIIVKDGIRFRITGNTNMAHTYQFTLESNLEEKFRKICRTASKTKKAEKNEEDDKNSRLSITETDTLAVFKAFKEKLEKSVYSKISSIRKQSAVFNEEKFKALPLTRQVEFLANAVNLFTANKVFADLRLLDGVKSAGGMPTPSEADYIIDQSPTGFFERKFKTEDCL